MQQGPVNDAWGSHLHTWESQGAGDPLAESWPATCGARVPDPALRASPAAPGHLLLPPHIAILFGLGPLTSISILQVKIRRAAWCS